MATQHKIGLADSSWKHQGFDLLDLGLAQSFTGAREECCKVMGTRSMTLAVGWCMADSLVLSI